MEVVEGLIIAVCILIPIVFIYEKQRKLKKDKIVYELLKAEWDQIKCYEQTDKDTEYLQILKDKIPVDDLDNVIDDITWNDLDMDSVFNRINETQSTMGEVYLYNMLRHPVTDIDVLKERKKIIDYYYGNKEESLKKQFLLSNIGKGSKVTLYEYKDLFSIIDKLPVMQYIITPILQMSSFIAICMKQTWGPVDFFILTFVNIYFYYKGEKKVEKYLPVFSQLGYMMDSIKSMDDFADEEIFGKYLENIKKASVIANRYKRFSRIFTSLTLGKFADIDMFFDSFVKPFLHLDLIVFNYAVKFVRENMQDIERAYTTISFIDSMIAVAEFRHKMEDIEEKDICTPSFTSHGVMIHADNIYHPMIEDPVCNSFDTSSSVLITGSNATGKSTFLKTIAVNAILAQSLYIVCAAQYATSFFCIMSSMSLKDNIYSGESYYMAEIRSIRRILEAIDEKKPVLCCIDEVLRGTNTVERIAASSTILEDMATDNVLCFVASHDIELTYILENQYKNYHFQEQVNDTGITCDYCLYEGRSYTRNAINLLKFFGYSEKIIDKAKERADYYTKRGEWF